MIDLAGRVALVTGGASGIGLAMGRTFLDAGMSVVLADSDPAYLEEARGLAEFHGKPAAFLPLDVTDRAAMAACRNAVLSQFGPVTVLCNNAGITASLPIEDATYDEWDRVLAVNLGGVINGVVTFLPDMRQQGCGHIVNTASMAAIVESSGSGGVYTAAKFAIRGLTQSLRLNVASTGIGVSLLCPGPVRTRIRESSLRQAGCTPATVTASTSAIGPDALSPVAVAAAVLAGVRANDAYIYTHAGFRDEVEDQCRELIAAMPPGPPADDRFNVERRARLAIARRDAAALGESKTATPA